MDILSNVIHYLLPALGVLFLIYGVMRQRINYVLIALWVSLVTMLLQYQIAGTEILGSHFNYKQAGLYSLNLIILVAALLYILFQLPQLRNKYIRAGIALISASLITGSVVLMINLWINARFIESRLPGTAVMQVVSFTPPPYCPYRYVFYKIGPEKQIHYLCPNYYGLIPSTGKADKVPDFIARQLMLQTLHQHRP